MLPKVIVVISKSLLKSNAYSRAISPTEVKPTLQEKL